MSRKTLVVAGMAAFFFAMSLATVALTEIALREHDNVAIVFAGLAMALWIYALVWWVNLWIDEIRRRMRSQNRR
jgi:hypothetical protein